MFLCEIFKKLENKTVEPKNLRNYIYICLKNESIRLNKVYTERRALSLNMKINEETEILDLIIEKDTRSYSIEFYKVIKVAKSILTSKEYEAVYMYFILGKTQTYISKTKLKADWNALPKKYTPKLFTIGSCQMGMTENYKGGGDLVIAASSQIANGYQKVYKRYYVYDSYINLKIDEFLLGLNAGTLVKIITVIKQTIYYVTNDIFEKIFKLFTSLMNDTGAFPECDLIHTRECNNITVAKYIDSILDEILREENQDISSFEPALSNY